MVIASISARNRTATAQQRGRATGPASQRTATAIALSACRIEPELQELEAMVVVVPEVILETAVEERHHHGRCRPDAEARREARVGRGVDRQRDEEQVTGDVREGLLPLGPLE